MNYIVIEHHYCQYFTELFYFNNTTWYWILRVSTINIGNPLRCFRLEVILKYLNISLLEIWWLWEFYRFLLYYLRCNYIYLAHLLSITGIFTVQPFIIILRNWIPQISEYFISINYVLEMYSMITVITIVMYITIYIAWTHL